MTKRALCVGINDYPGANMDLAGCVNDARDWQALLESRGYAVRHLPGQGLPQGLRITIGTAEQMAEIAAVLREIAE